MNIEQLRAVRAILQHDDNSSPAELVYYFVHELGVAPTDAWKAVYHRPPMQPANNHTKNSAGQHDSAQHHRRFF